ncbi:hypothetical protein LMG24076_05454 [Trinickia soli]|nr:hypothetical protein LMG24076_05454 [Trinickia soli]
MRVVGIANDRLLQRQRHAADVVHGDDRFLARMQQRMHVEHFLDCADTREDRIRRLLEQVLALRRKRLVIEPAQIRLELPGRLRRALRRNERIAARNVDVFGESQRDRLPCKRAIDLRRAAGHRRDDLGHRRLALRGQHHDRIAHPHFARFHAAHVAAEVVGTRAVLTCHPLHRKAQPIATRLLHRQLFEHVEQRLARIPGHALAREHDVVALERRHGHEQHVGQTQLTRKLHIGVADLVEARLAVVDQVHLVDRHDHVLQAQQLHDRAVAFRLRQQDRAAFFVLRHTRGVDQDDRRMRRRSARHHVARVLLVARRVGDDELAPRRGEVAIGHVDRDALLALGFQAVGQQRQIDFVAHGALVLRTRERRQLIR